MPAIPEVRGPSLLPTPEPPSRPDSRARFGPDREATFLITHFPVFIPDFRFDCAFDGVYQFIEVIECPVARNGVASSFACRGVSVSVPQQSDGDPNPTVDGVPVAVSDALVPDRSGPGLLALAKREPNQLGVE